MPYLIDGHNLIPKITGLSLQSIDDENQLIQKLQIFQQQSRKKVEVFFDNAPAGESGIRKIGGVKAHFVRQGKTADSAIMKRLSKLGNDARNWTVVSSDRQVLAAARSSRAEAISSEAFAQLMTTTNERTNQSASMKEEQISPAEVEEWLQLFQDKKSHNSADKAL